jgi:hypothetical protein
MRAKQVSNGHVLNLRIGEVVEVRSEREVLATLDENGELDALPFMPEMLQYCGQRFKVYKLATKLCDTINYTGMHRLQHTVHLEGLRCDGQAHGGCQAGCLIYWKEAWLQRVDAEPASATQSCAAEDALCTRETLMAATRKDSQLTASSNEIFSCQATEILRAAPTRVPSWDVRQYLSDVRSGNAPAFALIRTLSIALFNKFQGFSRRFFPSWLLIRDGKRFPFIEGTLTKTPQETLSLLPGELVQVKTKKEIVATLNSDNANRGLSFDVEMLKYCGQLARVLRPVDHVIDERTGEMLHFKNPCIILEGVICTGEYHRCCPRSIYPYWREIWLKRVK